VVLKDGSKLYQAMEFQGGKLLPAGWKASEDRQRVHEVEERADGIYVRLSSLQSIDRRSVCGDGDYESDKWAFNVDAARNCLKPGTESGADGKRRFKASDGKHQSMFAGGVNKKISSSSRYAGKGRLPFKRSGEVLAMQRERLSSQSDAGKRPEPGVMDPKFFKPFSLQNVEVISQNTNLYTFALAKGCNLGVKYMERHLEVRVKDSTGQFVTRQYTPVSPLSREGSFDLMVKLYKDGICSQVFERLRVGDAIDMRGPLGMLTIFSRKSGGTPYISLGSTPSKTTCVPAANMSMVAGGSGITPMLQIICESIGRLKVNFRLLFANHGYRDIPFVDQLRSLNKKHENFSVQFFCSVGPIPDDQRGDIFLGRLSSEVLKDRLFSPDEKGGSCVLVCGPPMFNDSMEQIAERVCGFKCDQIYTF
jgi:cytochrome-b5 reductase